MSASFTLLKPHLRDIGSLAVRRLLPALQARMIGPFVFFDHMGPAVLPAGAGVDVRPHPHIGLATVTYLFDGAMLHRDSLGNVQRIVPGDVNWMSAGRGIVHSERSPDDARAAPSTLHGIQTWVALPDGHEEDEPWFRHYAAATLPRIAGDGAELCVVAGSAFGATSPVATPTPTLYVELRLSAGAALTLPADYAERGVYLIDGDLRLDDAPLDANHLAYLQTADAVELSTADGAHAMLLGGAHFDGERIVDWNFVARTRERIDRAKADWRAQRFGGVPGETEWMPLPDAKA